LLKSETVILIDHLFVCLLFGYETRGIYAGKYLSYIWYMYVIYDIITVFVLIHLP